MVSTIYDHTDPPNSQTLYLSAIADVTGYPETDADDPGYYRQMRKFGCNILAVVQQYDVIKNSPVRGAMIGNSNDNLPIAHLFRFERSNDSFRV